MSFHLSKIKKFIFLFRNFFLDYFYFFSTYKGNRRNILNKLLGLYNLRSWLFRLPHLIYLNRNKKILQNAKKNSNFTKDSEFFTQQININPNFKKRLIHILNSEKGHDGAAKYFSKGGIDKVNLEKDIYFSKYIDVTNLVSKNINSLFSKIEFKDFIQKSSILLGYKVFLRDLEFSLSQIKGENSNSYWHSDAFYPIVKGFIYLNNITEDDSPFEYSLGSTSPTNLESYYEKWFTQEKILTSSPRVINRKDLQIINNNRVSFTGPEGTMIVANTQGFHRKGKNISGLERKVLSFEFKRCGIFERIFRSFL